MIGRPARTRVARVVAALVLVTVVLVAVVAPPASAAPARINGSGSSYVALAMQQWVADAQTDGLQVNYLPSGSPQGLQQFGQSLADFAGTEAEFSALGGGNIGDARGFQYVPDVAGAVAVMYNVDDKAGRKIDYLHLSRRTVARIFTGDIAFWDDPAISADNPLPNGNLVLPHEAIQVVYRGGQSGTTALFYDFVANMAPDIFGPWAAKNQFPTNVRIIQLDSSPSFAPKTLALQGSDQIAQYTASAGGKWSIAYDEFGYAKTYNVPAAWIENQAGKWVLPYAQNISSALESARLRDDLSQELSGVYNSPNADAYPISAYSYLVTQCVTSADRPTCKGGYTNPGISETLARWMRYIACEGQVNMARIGYSPLPKNLSQEIANAVGRLTGTAPETLTAENCANPRFRGSLGEGASSPKKDPLKDVKAANPAPTGGPTTVPAAGGRPGSAGAATGPATTAPNAAIAPGQTTSAAPGAGAATDPAGTGDPAAAAGEGEAVASSDELAAGLEPLTADDGTLDASRSAARWRPASPVAYDRPSPAASTVLPLVLLIALVLLPPLVGGVRRRRA